MVFWCGRIELDFNKRIRYRRLLSLSLTGLRTFLGDVLPTL